MYPAFFSHSRSLCYLVWCVIRLVAAPDPTKFASAWWDDGPSEEVTLPSAHELLAAFSHDPALQIHQPEWRQRRPEATMQMLPVLRPELPGSPSLGHHLIANPAFFHDVSLDSSLIPSLRGHQDGPLKASISGPDPIFSYHPDESSAPGVASFSSNVRSTGNSYVERDSYVTHNTPIPDDSSFVKIPQIVSSQDIAHHIAGQPWVHFALNQLDSGPNASPFDAATMVREPIPRKSVRHDKSKALSDSNLNTTPAQSHTLAFTSTSTAKQSNRDDTKAQAPMQVDNPVVEVTPEIIPGDQNERHQQSTQVSRLVHLNSPLDIIRNGSPISKLETKEVRLKGRRKSHLNDQLHVHRFLLKHYDDQFFNTVNSKQFFSKKTTQKFQYPDFPLAMAEPQRPGLGYIIRVICASDQNHLQSPDVLVSQYKYLIKCIHDFHEARLNTLDIPIYVHRLQHQKMFDWLYREAFDNPVPLMGLKNTAVPEWGKDDILKSTQVELLRVLSQNTIDYPITLSAATKLFQTFIDKQPDDSVYHTAPRLSLEKSTEISTSPEFREKMKFLMKISTKAPWDFESLVTSRKVKVSLDRLIPLVLKPFKEKFEEATLRNHYLSIHPRVSIAVYFLKDKPNVGWIRVIKKPQIQILTKKKATNLLTKLAMAVTYIHVELQRSTSRQGKDFIQKRKAIFQWLITVIFEPKQGFPIYGKLDINPGLAPWEEERYRNTVIFTPVQLRLIQYFSEPLTSLTLRETAAFIITAWYHDHDDTEFCSWTKLPLQD
ncbi:hypothetical protein PGT21_022814 [Puccinia graminis f. sp. tritici]|uniref:Uncharacterized protein n=3 Tax=Puccinia graminis f. sp. tritici TaxID=56615 RepID=A0A5B0P506_PUCGR|nr:hypothetical protein PGT21_022814 [Puccinia graminis f. sp. tritici]